MRVCNFWICTHITTLFIFIIVFLSTFTYVSHCKKINESPELLYIHTPDILFQFFSLLISWLSALTFNIHRQIWSYTCCFLCLISPLLSTNIPQTFKYIFLSFSPKFHVLHLQCKVRPLGRMKNIFWDGRCNHANHLRIMCMHSDDSYAFSSCV